MANILVVDDNRAIRAVLSELLTEAGHAVKTAEDGVEALGLLRRGRFDWMLADAVVPMMWGVELARVVKGQCPDTKVVLMSGSLNQDSVEHEGVFDCFLKKPFSGGELSMAIDSLGN